MTLVRETQDMIAGMRPVLRPGLGQFRCVTDPTEAATLLPKALASFREAEALSLILPVTATDEDTVDIPMRCITLEVHSALDGIGLTAAVAQALTDAAIPCNVVAAFHHDHIFVPAAQAQTALDTLLALSATARDGT